MLKITSVAVLLLGTVQISAQQWLQDIKRMNRTYSEATSFGMDITVQMFEKKNSPAPVATYTGKVSRQGDNYYSEMMNKTTLLNNHYYLIVDRQLHMILLRKNNRKSQAPIGNNFSPSALDSILQSCTRATYLKNDATEKTIHLVTTDGQYSQMDITIDAVSNTLKEVILYNTAENGEEAAEAEKVVIRYTNIKINKSYPTAFFSESRFITINGLKTKPTQAYQNFTVIDQDKKN